MKRAAIVLLLTMFAAAAHAQSEGAAKYFANLALVDQDGKRVDLYDDLMKGHVVVISSFFASCTGVCPAMAGSFQQLQKRFASELGHELHFISISVDPEHDTPAKLHAYAAKMQAKKGWHFLTGPKADVDAALRKIGEMTPNPSAHSNVVIVGNVPTGLWKKMFGLAGAGPIGDAVQSALDDHAVKGSS
jgi:protein SCO1/2